jgi:hypothetical protein
MRFWACRISSWAFDIKGSDIGSGTEQASISNATVMKENEWQSEIRKHLI